MAEVYRNLHTDTWSVREDGVVVDHPDAVAILNPRFVVQPAGNRKVRESRRKNVHAFVRGQRVDTEEYWNPAYDNKFRRATYNPYQNTSFVDSLTGEPVATALFAWLDDDFNVYYVPDEAQRTTGA